jgi:hypothetical protein
MEGGIEAAVVDAMAADRFQPSRQHPGQGHPAGRDAEQQQIATVGHALQHLGGETVEGAAQILPGEKFEPTGCAHRGEVVRRRLTKGEADPIGRRV